MFFACVLCRISKAPKGQTETTLFLCPGCQFNSKMVKAIQVIEWLTFRAILMFVCVKEDAKRYCDVTKLSYSLSWLWLATDIMNLWTLSLKLPFLGHPIKQPNWGLPRFLKRSFAPRSTLICKTYHISCLHSNSLLQFQKGGSRCFK